MRFYHRIQFRIFSALVLLSGLGLTLMNILLQGRLRHEMEAELGAKLTAVASMAAVHFTPPEVRIMLETPGRITHARLSRELELLKATSGVKRIYFFLPGGQSLADTDSSHSTPGPYFHLSFHQAELNRVNQGQQAWSHLFTGIDGQPTMSGFAPIFMDSKVVATAAVEGSANFLQAIQSLQRQLLMVWGSMFLASVALAWFLARGLSRPVSRLASRARSMGRGEMEQAIVPLGRDEVADLASAMETMRQQLLSRETELKAMVGGVAHEIRNPLAGMALYTDLLNDRLNHDAEARAHLKKISRESAALQRIVDHFLDFARPGQPAPEEASLKPLLEESLSLARAASGASPEVLLDCQPSVKVMADDGQLRQILLNLLNNAFDAAGEAGRVTMTVTVAGNTATLLLTDNGPGMTQEMADQCFTPFVSSKASGTGLGLAIARNLARRNGGQLVLIETTSHGTVFELSLISAS